MNQVTEGEETLDRQMMGRQSFLNCTPQALVLGEVNGHALKKKKKERVPQSSKYRKHYNQQSLRGNSTWTRVSEGL